MTSLLPIAHRDIKEDCLLKNGLDRKPRQRRRFVLLIALALAVFAPAAVAGEFAETSPALPNADQAEQMLRDGNARFAAQQSTFPNQDRRRLQEISAEQHPFATILTCSDSRVPTELIFDAGLGDLVVVRVAGNVADVDEIATIEYSVDRLNTPLLIVLGHTDCGAVSAKVGGVKVGGFMPQLFDNIDGALTRAMRRTAGISQDNETLLSCTTQDNVFKSIEDIITQSPAVYQRAADGRLRIVGGVYNVASGKVQWLGVHPRQQCLELSDVTVAQKAAKSAERKATTAKGNRQLPTHAEGVTADLAMLMLREGNKRFVAENRNYPNLNPSRWDEVAAEQTPYATILSCSDSRVAVEHIFDAGLGEIFSVRVAGNIADVDEIGSIEYGVGQLHTPLLVVMGHTACDAVADVCSGAPALGSFGLITGNIMSAVNSAKAAAPATADQDLVAHAVKENVWQSINEILSRSGDVRRLVESGYLQVAGAVYHLDDGYVEWLGPHPEQKKIMAKQSRAVKPAEQLQFNDQIESENAFHDDYRDD